MNSELMIVNGLSKPFGLAKNGPITAGLHSDIELS
jgi:hypothetical protein